MNRQHGTQSPFLRIASPAALGLFTRQNTNSLISASSARHNARYATQSRVTMKGQIMKTAKLGTVSRGTMRARDLIPAFADALRALRGALPKTPHNNIRALRGNFDSEEADDVVTELFEELESLAPDYTMFGAHPGDGSDYGFWLIDDWQQCAKDDGVLFVDDTSAVPKGFSGIVCHVNDHGNATLYSARNGKLREVWSIV